MAECHLCGEQAESVEHIIFECPVAAAPWKLFSVIWDGLQVPVQSMKQWWMELAKVRIGWNMNERLELSARNLWKARNHWIFNREKSEPHVIVKLAIQEWMEFKEAIQHTEGKAVQNLREKRQEEWRKPDQGITRIKATSAISEKNNKGAVGIVAIDDSGSTTHAWAVTREGSYSPVAADLEAVRCALILAQKQGWRKIEIMLDVKAIVLCLQHGTHPTLDSMMIAEDISILLQV